MHAEDPTVDDRTEREIVEHLAAPAPDVGGAVLALAFVVEAIDLGDLAGFVVSSEDEEVFGVFDLVSEEEANGFERLFSSIDVVAEEEVVGFWGEPAVFKKSQKVVVLPMNVAYKIGGRLLSAPQLRG